MTQHLAPMGNNRIGMVETINNLPVTVIRRPFDADEVRKQLAIGVPVMGVCWYDEEIRIVLHQDDPQLDSIVELITILPPLPRYPKPKDAALLYRYAAEGLFLSGRYFHESKGWVNCTWVQFRRIVENGGHSKAADPYEPEYEITHAVTADGQRVEVAIV